MFPGTDLAALAFIAAAFVAHRLLQRRRARRDPGATLQSQQAAIRAAWVAEILRSGNGILGVQTLRNALMGSIFFASNTIFLVLGTLTLTAQGHLAETWTLLDPGATRSPSFAQAKLLLLLLTLLAAFFCFVNAIRLFSHASIRIGAREEDPERVTAQIDAAWSYQGLGIRCYYFAAPILFWLFGALWFVLAGLGSIALMHRFDRVPQQRGTRSED
jgi:uncharacterized membrane protein